MTYDSNQFRLNWHLNKDPYLIESDYMLNANQLHRITASQLKTNTESHIDVAFAFTYTYTCGEKKIRSRIKLIAMGQLHCCHEQQNEL